MSQQKEGNGNLFEQGEPGAMETDGGNTAMLEHHESILSLIPYAKQPPAPPFHPSNFSNYTWDELDESSLSLIASLDPESRRIYQKLGHVPSLRRYELGTFQIDEYHSITFDVIPALGEAGYSEFFEYPPGVPSPLDKVEEKDSLSPLMRFLQLTNKNIPVPLVLWEFDDRSEDPQVERALAGRELVDTLDNFGRKAALLTAPPPPTAAAAAWTCFNGGDDVFSSAYCESKGIWYCDNDSWLSLTRSSGDSKRYVSHSRVAACGGGYYTYLEHQYRYWNWWKAKWVWTAVNYPNSSDFWQTLGPGDVKYWKHVGTKKRRRKIKIWTTPNSYFRAWSAFYN